ncbi:MAG: NUMOD3 domain-containing DNA-binding protein [Candidatus Competibacter sp.]
MKAYKHSEESKRKMSEAKKGKRFSDEAKENMRQAALARVEKQRKDMEKLKQLEAMMRG